MRDDHSVVIVPKVRGAGSCAGSGAWSSTQGRPRVSDSPEGSATSQPGTLAEGHSPHSLPCTPLSMNQMPLLDLGRLQASSCLTPRTGENLS